jgi:hypothetical protein
MYILDAYLTVEGNRLKWIRENQQTIRAENYANLTNYVNTRRRRDAEANATNNTDMNNNDPSAINNNTAAANHQDNSNNIPVDSFGRPRPVQCWNHLSHRQRVEQQQQQRSQQQYQQWQERQVRQLNERLSQMVQEPIVEDDEVIGQRIILPSTFRGSKRQMQESYRDAMAVVAKFGKPDLFLTMTANAKWREIVENVPRYQDSSFRPDLHARVMRLKLAALIRQIRKEHIFGRPIAHIHVIEFQKRGLPHAHILITLAQEDKIVGVAAIDYVVCAELPNRTTHPRLFEIVTRCMLHGPCGQINPDCSCMQNEKKECSKDYPKVFVAETIENDPRRHKAIYRRRENGPTFQKIVAGERDFLHIFDNSDVVPYSPYLLLKYNCHINVEVCSSIRSVKYLYKYVYNGSRSCQCFDSGRDRHFHRLPLPVCTRGVLAIVPVRDGRKHAHNLQNASSFARSTASILSRR